MAYSYVWPATLPKHPNANGYTETGGPNVLRTGMDNGPAKQRRRGTKPQTVQCTYQMTVTQLATFETFVATTLRGTARFGWWHPRLDQEVEARIVPAEDGLYVKTYLTNIYWDVTLTIEIMP